MNVDRAVMAFAGMMILVSVLLAFYVSPYWLALTAFVGLNLLQGFRHAVRERYRFFSYGDAMLILPAPR